MPDDDPLTAAVDELNRRLVRAHRRGSRITLTVTVSAGLAAAAAVVLLPGFRPATGIAGWLSAAIVAAVGFAVAAGVFSLSELLSGAVVRRWQQRWLDQLARQHRVDQPALAALILPLGGQALSPPAAAARRRRRRALLIGALGLLTVTALLLAFDLREQLTIGLVAVLMISVAALMQWYLGWRAPH